MAAATTTASLRVHVTGGRQHEAARVLADAHALGVEGLTGCEVSTVYLFGRALDQGEIDRLAAELLADPVTQRAAVTQRAVEPAGAAEPAQPPGGPGRAVEVALRPGVTDVAARELARGMEEIGIERCPVLIATRYDLAGALDEPAVRRIAERLLANPTIEHYALGELPAVFEAPAPAVARVDSIPLTGLDDAGLAELSRRRLLSLDAAELREIQGFYREAGREPTDVELETIAQTWSEHCAHKTFRAEIDYEERDADGGVALRRTVHGLFDECIRAVTEELAPAWLRSVFVDNAGIVAFAPGWDLAFKVETHNHPSALEPFGGANTGVGGVVRDILGVSARPIAATNVLCFGPVDLDPAGLPDGVLHPRLVAEGVVAGVGDYGNKLGLPTVNGGVLYDEGYVGNPLVYCGCVGLLPAGAHRTDPRPGDLVVAVGGRTGRDGLHGATFSSAELAHDTVEVAGAAVQIGDPITEKALIELIEEARDAGLYSAVTDCGAGGFSSAVGEMGRRVGVEVDLAAAPLKYPGLLPWEIWLSEAQERMALAVPPEHLPELRRLAARWELELAVLGRFTGEGELVVRFGELEAARLPMSFLHDGLPRRRMTAVWQPPPRLPAPTLASAPTASAPTPSEAAGLLLAALTHPCVASKEPIVRTYDHEVRGGTLVRPFCGPAADGPADAAVLVPLGLWELNRGFAVGCGVNPRLGKLDPFAMAWSAVDEAVRNVVAVGADPDQVALLDNFCWGNPTLPDRLGGLTRAALGCREAALAYRAPFISGKDSLFNEFEGRPIPGTLLISALAIVPDAAACVTSELKAPGGVLYLLGESRTGLGGSLLAELLGDRLHPDTGRDLDPPPPPVDALGNYRALHGAIRAGLVRAAHDCSEGGLAVAVAEMCLGGRLGAELEAPGADWLSGLFGEADGRLVVEVAPEHAERFEAALAGAPLARLGEVRAEPRLRIAAGAAALEVGLDALVQAWKGER